MDDSSATAVRLDDARVPPQRPCTRCDGQQHVVAAESGMGKYRCDTCQLVVGFDVDGDRPEFLLDRGLPGRYSKHVFGTELQATERRLEGASER